jgi:hypothetical protein
MMKEQAMNERIKELADQAGLQSFYVEYSPWQVEFEKYAELIIRECLGDLKERIAIRYQGSEKDRDIAYGMEIVYMDIVDNFGVEE